MDKNLEIMKTQNRNETELPLDSGAAGSNDDNEYKGQRVLGLPGPSSTSHPFVTCCREQLTEFDLITER